MKQLPVESGGEPAVAPDLRSAGSSRAQGVGCALFGAQTEDQAPLYIRGGRLKHGEWISLTPDFIELAATGFPFQVERFYAALSSAAASISPLKPETPVADAASDRNPNPGPALDPDLGPTLGGQLLYAGELDAQARALVVAANIAGAATLAVSADAGAQRQAIRDGVVDFVVNSLDEALRILKNEIRKRETVAVCVAVATEGCESDFALEMLERGVRPDLLGPGGIAAGKLAALIPPGLARIEPVEASADQVFVAWSVARAPAVWLPALDKIAAGCLTPEASGCPPLASPGSALYGKNGAGRAHFAL